MTSPLILLAMLCCAVGCAAAGDKQFGCMHDQVAWNSSAMPARIVDSVNSRGKVKGATMSAGTEKWEAIRFKVFSEDLNTASKYCTESGQSRPTFIAPSQTAICKTEDILTNEKKKFLLDQMIAGAIKLHSERLLVQPVTGNILVPRYTEGPCRTFTIPSTHFKEGVSDADMIMYVSAGPTEYPKSWAGTCSVAPVTHRPVVGAVNVGPAIIGTSDNGVRVAAHEIAHALGFNIENMHFLKMVTSVKNIRGWDRLVVSSNKTLEKAKSHYNCDKILGMELENEGDLGIVYSHWKGRNAKDELMAGITEAGYYTALTLSAFESMGYYRANWDMEETMEWGSNKGCQFLEGKCVTNGKSNYPDMFCTDVSSTHVCTSDRRGLGMCSLGKAQYPLPDVFHYFNDSTIGGASPFLDFCPIVVQYTKTGCKNGDELYMPGSRVGPTSLCLKGERLRIKDSFWNSKAVQDICAEISCENNTVNVRYAGDNTWHKCPEGSYIVPKGSFTEGKIVCPSYAEICGNKKHTTVASGTSKSNNEVPAGTGGSTSLIRNSVPSERTNTQENCNVGTLTSTTLTVPEKAPAQHSNDCDAVRQDVADDVNVKSPTPPVSVTAGRQNSTVPGETGNNGATGRNLERNPTAVSTKPIGDSSTVPAAAGNNVAPDGKLESTKRPVAGEPIKKSSPKETDVNKPNKTLSATPVLSGAKMVNLTKISVDSSLFLHCWLGRVIPMCGCLIYVFALCWAF